jgi:hypothetical protein
MIKVLISLSFVDSPPRPNLPAGLHHISDVMPLVLDGHRLSPEQDPNSMHPTLVTDANGLFDVMLAGLESAIAS